MEGELDMEAYFVVVEWGFDNKAVSILGSVDFELKYHQMCYSTTNRSYGNLSCKTSWADFFCILKCYLDIIIDI